MKLISVFLFAACLHAGTAANAQTITLNLSNEPIEKAFAEIKKQVGINFFYTEELIGLARPLSISVKAMPLNEVLSKCFEDQPITYTYTNNTIVIILRTIAPADTMRSVKGRVRSDNLPLAGVSVSIKNSLLGTRTNQQGEFLLKNIPENSILVFTSVGYEQVEIFCNNRSEMSVDLRVAMGKLDETIVIGYGITTKRNNTGNVSKIRSAEISKQPVSNPLLALQGRVPGLMITQESGITGTAVKVQLRGQNSISAGNNPLYIIDGVPYTSNSLIVAGGLITGGSPLNYINPNDIESIEILKDADATAIYGSRGANGVILITTKSAKEGMATLTANFYQGFGKVTNQLTLLNTRQYLDLRYEAFQNDQMSPAPEDYDLTIWDTTRYTNWQKKIIGNAASVTNAQLSYSAGTKYMQVMMSAAYYRESSAFAGSSFNEKKSFRVQVTTLSRNEKFRQAFSLNYLRDNNHLPTTDLTTSALTLAPNAPDVYNSTGNLNWITGFDNPMKYIMIQYEGKVDNLLSNMQFSYRVIKNLQLKASLGFTKTGMDELTMTPTKAFDPALNIRSGNASFGSSFIQSWIIEPQAQYEIKNNAHHLTVLAGLSLQHDQQFSELASGSGYASDDLLRSRTAAATIVIKNSREILYRYKAAFGRISYKLKDACFLQATGRMDRSSRFGPSRQAAAFGAIGAAWIFTKNRWVHDAIPFLSFGKIRMSYGTAGNDQVPDYGYLDLYSPTVYPYGGTGGWYASSLFNKGFGWEVNRKLEAAVETGFFKDRILLNIALYRNRSGNQLVGYPLPAITGFQSVQANLPAIVENKGIEIDLTARIIQHKNFKWTSFANISIPRNTLIGYPHLANSAYANALEIGQSLSLVRLFHTTGVDPVTGNYGYLDLDKNGSGTDYPADLQGLKKTDQRFFGGWQHQLHWKTIELDFLFQFVSQSGYNYLSQFEAPGFISNQPTYVLNRWRKEGDMKPVQKATQTYGSSWYAQNNIRFLSDGGLSDASFIRLKNISISWTLPARIISGIGLHTTQLYIRGQNLLTISQYEGLDPETISKLPPLKMIVFGINCSL